LPHAICGTDLHEYGRPIVRPSSARQARRARDTGHEFAGDVV
jgi:threonine dehydrogenase-like Zn-dependent dehydrogenase